ncbi:NCS2 family permease [Hazenella sp. IB182357]|uniref:NCS2 family permease n=1 Tax=Polycladospora coralii TaxID=2771432 RepID=A0A926N8D3_9BACL|nr:NCS2 family permease [Polycladospora coralii]MBD1371647.1 NCS2 family permease [Polycladospora coralii]MBS7529114.1 NCS2 family permease [Polycladospora coralii]
MNRLFSLKTHQTTGKQEVLAGLTSFFTVVYIIIVNGRIIADAGIPLSAAIMATALTSFFGCLLIGLWANAPLVLVPGMGVNAFFTYTIVHGMGLNWQEALTVVFISGLLYMIVAFTSLSGTISRAIPSSLKQAITVGVGLLIAFIGLQKGGLVIADSNTSVAIGDLGEPNVWLTLFALVTTFVLFARNVRGHFLIAILITTVAGAVSGIHYPIESNEHTFSISTYLEVIGSFSFSSIGTFAFWSASFVLTMVLVFENMGLIQGMLTDQSKFKRSFQANAISSAASGFLGTSPTVASLESATGIASGGKTGLTAVTAGLLFLLSLFFIPFIKWIPDSAIAAVLIVVGGLMMQEVKHIPFHDFSEGFPAFITLLLIPLTYSIPDGIAFGFISYAILKIAVGKRKDASATFYVIALLFLLQLILHG